MQGMREEGHIQFEDPSNEAAVLLSRQFSLPYFSPCLLQILPVQCNGGPKQGDSTSPFKWDTSLQGIIIATSGCS